jgi:hypothetical protein
MKLALNFPDIPEEEALKLASGVVSERIANLTRKAILAARSKSELARRLTFGQSDDDEGVTTVLLDNTIYGVARSYNRYWQIYIRSEQRNIRRTTWPLLRQAIEEHIRDAT